MPTRRMRPLALRYALGVAAVALPMLLLIGGLAGTQFAAERTAQINLIARDLAKMRLMLEALVKPATDHVQQLRHVAEDHLAGRLPTPSSPLRASLRPQIWDADGQGSSAVLLEREAGAPAAPLAGNLHGRADLVEHGDPLEIDMALNLFEPIRSAHLTNPHLRWSYYFSGTGAFLTIYPFAGAQDTMQTLQSRTFDDYLAAMYSYDVYRLATPARNPDRSSYWTPIYFDAGGAGWMVSHAAPVYVADTFAGVVGTDILLDFLNAALGRQHRAPGRVWIVDDRGDLLADSAGIVRGSGSPSLAGVLPQPLAAMPRERLFEPAAKPRQVGRWEVMALPLGNTPWHLLFVAPESEITALVLAQLWPYALLLGGVLAMLILGQHLLQSHFVGPAIALAGRVQEQSHAAAVSPQPRVPGSWRPWFAAVDDAFESSRRHLAHARQSEARFLGAAESVPDGLMILDQDDRIMFYNSRHRDLLPEALRRGLRTGVRFPDWIREGLARGPVYHRDMGPDYARTRLASRPEGLSEREHKHADGRWVRVREGRMPDGGRVVVTLDITARKEAEEALRQSEARYRAVVEGQTEFIQRLRPDGTLTFVNDAYCRYRGLAREVLLAGFDDTAHYSPDQQERIRAAWAGITLTRPTVTHELVVPRAGGLVYEEWTDAGIFDEAGALVEIQAVGRDITERKQAEADLQRERELAHQREKMASLGSLLAGVAHELNNPLSVVVGRALMLEDEVQDPRVRASLTRLRAAAERCARIIKTFLALARNQPRAAARPVDVHKVLDGVLDLAYGLRSAGVETERVDGGDVPPVMADADQLGQVLLNLVVNAQQALEEVPPPRRLWLRTVAGPGVVRIEVADNGPGVPVELRNRVLEPFFTTKPVGAGTGLGLSVCHSILGHYGGTIAIDDRPGGGARFIVTLPAARDGAEQAAAPRLARAAGSGGSVLVVDDEPEVVAMLTEVLALDGHRVETAPDGVAALELLREGVFDAVLCDVRMPRLDGPGLARELAATRPDLAARLILMTGDALRVAAAVPPSARDRLLEKPLDPDEVRRRVGALVDHSRTTGAAIQPAGQATPGPPV